MSIGYIFRRFLIFLVVVWAAATFNFLLPRLGGANPIRQKLVSQGALSGSVQLGLEEMIKEYETKFGLDQPLGGSTSPTCRIWRASTSTIPSPITRAKSST